MKLTFPLILDGATGTALIKNGYPGDISSEEWTLLHPEVIQSIQRSYIDAGSQVIYTPTFGANRIKMRSYGKEDCVRDYNMRLAGLSKEVAEGRAFVAGDLAPSGLSMAPMGEAPFSDIYDLYLEQASALEDAGVDLFVIETISSVADARAAMLAVKQVCSKPVMVSFTCNKNGKTFTGADVAAALVTMQSMGANVFGLNCSYGPDDMLPQLKRLSEYTKLPLLAKPNAGIPEMVDGKAVYDCPPEHFISHLEEMAAAGVMVFGGCCGTDETHVAALSSAVQKLTMCPPSSERRTDILLSTERAVFCVDPDMRPGSFIPCDEDIEDNATDLDEDEMLGIDLDADPDLDQLEASQWCFQSPVCFTGNDAGILESALKRFQGRAAYTGELSAAGLEPLAERYGLVVL